MTRAPARNCPVADPSTAITSSGVPSATTWPPCSPAPGPRSTMWSAARIVPSSCSTTITVLPRSLSRSSVAIRRALSRWCGPIEGEVADPDVVEEAQALVDLAQHEPRDLALRVGELELLEPLDRAPRG